MAFSQLQSKLEQFWKWSRILHTHANLTMQLIKMVLSLGLFLICVALWSISSTISSKMFNFISDEKVRQMA